ncbi:MAG: cytochrome c oxidase subunit 3 [Flavobacteriia bacterium]|nr:cytochrome c oxidase subunit 3 [Flavobacteriia bacterium]
MADEALREQRKRAAKPMLWIGIASMAMMFAGLTSGYIVQRSTLVESNSWFSFQIPTIFIYSTIVMVVSSAVMMMAVRAARSGNFSRVNIMLFLTLVLGALFAIFQVTGWSELIDSKIFFTGAGSEPSGSWFYVITLFHLLHVGAGLIVLLVTIIKNAMKKYTQEDYQGIEMAAIFWHFVDILWILLFLFLAIIR